MTTIRQRGRLGLLAVLVSLGVTLLLGSPASGHTDLLRANPAPDSSVDPGLARVELDFSSPVLSRLAEVVVKDAAGRDHVTEPPAAFDDRVVAQVDTLSPGAYRVAYRVVAADGHPIVGGYAFTVSRTVSRSGSGTTATVSDVRAATPGAGSTVAPSSPGGGAPWLIPLVGGLAVVLVVAVRLSQVVRRVHR